MAMKRVVICGSKRFKKEIASFVRVLRNQRVIVHEPLLAEIDWEKEFSRNPLCAQLIASGLNKRHLDLIRMADVVFIYNLGGYMGPSTIFELGFARALNKPVWCLEMPPQEELWMRDEIERVVNDPERLANLLLD